MLAPSVTANSKGYGLTPMAAAEAMAMGDMSTAVAVLLINMVRTDVVK